MLEVVEHRLGHSVAAVVPGRAAASVWAETGCPPETPGGMGQRAGSGRTQTDGCCRGFLAWPETNIVRRRGAEAESVTNTLDADAMVIRERVGSNLTRKG